MSRKEEPFNCGQCGHISHEVGDFDYCPECEHEYLPSEAGQHDECPNCGANYYEHTCPSCGSGTDYLPINTMIGYANKKQYRQEQAEKKAQKAAAALPIEKETKP